MQAQFFAVCHAPRGVFDNARDRRTVQRQQLPALLQGADHAGEQAGAVGTAGHILGHVRRHLEQGRELRIVLLQDVVDIAIALQHDLDVQRYRLRLQLHRAAKTEQLFQGLDTDFPRLERALQRRPGVGAGQQLVGVEYQVTAVGAVQGAGFDQVEVGDQCAHLGYVLDPAQQVAEARAVLVDHRRGGQLLVVDQHVDVVLGEFPDPVFGVVGNGRILLHLGKGLRLFQDIRVHRLEVIDNRRELAVLFLQLIQYRVDCQFAEFAIQLLEFIAALFLPAGQLPDDHLQLLFQLVDNPHYPILFLFGFRFKRLRCNDFLVLHGREGVAAGCLDHGDTRRHRFLAQGLEGLFFTVLVLFPEFLHPGLVLVALEGGGQQAQQFFHRPVHIAAQPAGLAPGQAQGDRPVGAVEVIHIAPVKCRLAGRGGGVFEQRAQHAVEQLAFAYAGAAQQEDVVALVGYLQAKLQRLDSPALAQVFGQGFELGGRLERQFGFIAAAVESFQRQRAAGRRGLQRVCLFIHFQWISPGVSCPKDSPACTGRA